MSEFCRSFTALAKALGTTPRTLRNWRDEFPGELPIRDPKRGHDVAAWKLFALERARRPARVYEIPAAPLRTVVSEWERRRELLFGLRDAVEFAAGEGQIDRAKIGDVFMQTARLVVQIGRVWDAGIDEAGYLANSYAIARQLQAQ